MVDLARFTGFRANSQMQTARKLLNQLTYWFNDKGALREGERDYVMVVDRRGVPLKTAELKTAPGPDGTTLVVMVLRFGENTDDEE